MVRAVFVGDSQMDNRGWPDALGQSYGWTRVNGPNANWSARGAVGGSYWQDLPGTVASLAAAAPLRVAAYLPDVVVIWLGTNDYYYATPSHPTATTPASWRAAVHGTLAELAGLRHPPRIVTVGLAAYAKPLDLGVPAWAVSEEDVRNQMDAITAEETLAAGGTFVVLRDGMTPEMLYPDGVHINAAGEAFLLDRLKAAI